MIFNITGNDRQAASRFVSSLFLEKSQFEK